MRKNFVKTLATAVVLCLALLLTGCITVNMGSQETEAPAATPVIAQNTQTPEIIQETQKPEPSQTSVSGKLADPGTLSSNWEDSEFIFDGKKYSLPFAYKDLEAAGWTFDIKDYGYEDGYVLNPGGSIISTIELRNPKYPDKHDFHVNVGFKNNDSKVKDIYECDIDVFTFEVNKIDKPYPDMIVVGGLTIGSSIDQAKSILGSGLEINEGEYDPELPDFLYRSAEISSDYTKYLRFTSTETSGLISEIKLSVY